MNNNRMHQPTPEEFQDNLAREMNNQKETKDPYEETEKEVQLGIQEYQEMMNAAMNNPFIAESLKRSNLGPNDLTFETASTEFYDDGKEHVYTAYRGKFLCLRIVVDGTPPFKALAFRFDAKECSKECQHAKKEV